MPRKTRSYLTPRNFVAGFFAIGLGIWIWQSFAPGTRAPVSSLAINVPDLSSQARAGKAAFDNNCASCHGINASGTDRGPPLVHDIYNPGHHADEAFFLAARLGVRSHHWRFGDMPQQPQITKTELAAVVRYVRELQVANGINYRPHRM